MKPSQPRRDWAPARAKVEHEGRCRNCRSRANIEAAHIVGREHDRFIGALECGRIGFDLDARVIAGDAAWVVEKDRIIPLCRDCHRDQHAHKISLEPLLTAAEAAQAVLDTGSLEAARIRVSGQREQAA